jgi:hypothetical protein
MQNRRTCWRSCRTLARSTVVELLVVRFFGPLQDTVDRSVVRIRGHVYAELMGTYVVVSWSTLKRRAHPTSTVMAQGGAGKSVVLAAARPQADGVLADGHQSRKIAQYQIDRKRSIPSAQHSASSMARILLSSSETI